MGSSKSSSARRSPVRNSAGDAFADQGAKGVFSAACASASIGIHPGDGMPPVAHGTGWPPPREVVGVSVHGFQHAVDEVPKRPRRQVGEQRCQCPAIERYRDLFGDLVRFVLAEPARTSFDVVQRGGQPEYEVRRQAVSTCRVYGATSSGSSGTGRGPLRWSRTGHGFHRDPWGRYDRRLVHVVGMFGIC